MRRQRHPPPPPLRRFRCRWIAANPTRHTDTFQRSCPNNARRQQQRQHRQRMAKSTILPPRSRPSYSRSSVGVAPIIARCDGKKDTNVAIRNAGAGQQGPTSAMPIQLRFRGITYLWVHLFVVVVARIHPLFLRRRVLLLSFVVRCCCCTNPPLVFEEASFVVVICCSLSLLHESTPCFSAYRR